MYHLRRRIRSAADHRQRCRYSVTSATRMSRTSTCSPGGEQTGSVVGQRQRWEWGWGWRGGGGCRVEVVRCPAGRGVGYTVGCDGVALLPCSGFATLSDAGRKERKEASIKINLNKHLFGTMHLQIRVSPPRVFPNPVRDGNLSSAFRCHRISLVHVGQRFDSRSALYIVHTLEQLSPCMGCSCHSRYTLKCAYRRILLGWWVGKKERPGRLAPGTP